jgi:hypothetical protein
MHRSLRIAAVTLLVMAMGAPAGAQTDASVIGLIAGQGDRDINQTKDRYAVHGTDLGFMWRDSRGRVALMFGDTYGAGWGGNGAGPDTADWRMNVLAFSTDTNLSDGLTIDSMVTDRPGHAKQLIGRWLPRLFEETVIPTAGISVGGRDYVHYMSIRSWDPWVTNYAGIAYSDDGGQNWVKSTAAWWPNTGGMSRFQLGAFVRDAGYVYLFGTPNGRFGNAHLLRVPEAQVLDVSRYEFWTAAGWSPSADGAIPVMAGQVGELSVQYNAFLGKWVALHLDEQRTAIVMRTAPSLTGPWTGGEVIAHGREHPGLYGGFMHPDSGADLYFALSRWQPYHVELMRLPLTGRALDANLVQNGGFEDWPGTWRFNGQGGVDLGKDLAHSGRNNGWVRGTRGWHDMHEQIVVRPGQRYRITGWVRSSESSTDGYFGVRAGNRVVAEQKFGFYHDYTRLSVEFVADTASLDVYAGTWAVHGDTWVQVDDIALEAA